jgi:hypothetical protein
VLGGTDQDLGVAGGRRTAVDQSLRHRGVERTADHAHRAQLHDVVREREQLRQGAERIALEVPIQAGDEHDRAALDEVADDAGERDVEELRLVDRDDLVTGREQRDLRGHRDRLGIHGLAAVRRDLRAPRVPFAEAVLEQPDRPPGDPVDVGESQELAALVREHGAGDDGEPARGCHRRRSMYCVPVSTTAGGIS